MPIGSPRTPGLGKPLRAYRYAPSSKATATDGACSASCARSQLQPKRFALPTSTISTPAELEAMGKAARVRVGIRTAAAWSGLSLEELPAFAVQLAAAGADV